MTKGDCMKRSIFLGFILVSLFMVRLAAAEDPAGKTLFLANKCNTCHSLQADGIEAKVKSTAKVPPPDLSTIGDVKTADWIVKYLKKEEALNNKKHAKAWTGKDEDLMTIAKWLEGHKKAVK
jgi:cbb3-type cytochrome oxidase cytochrome c subunit